MSSMFHKIKIHTLIVAMIFGPGIFLQKTATAADQEYDIEIVVIEDISDRYAQSENWPIIPEETSNSNKLQSETNSIQNEKRIKLLPESSFRLKDEVARIDNGKEFKILIHTAWRQAGLDKQSAFPVHITSNNMETNPDGSYIEGDMTLVMSRYLHLSGDLTYYKAEKEGYVPYPVKFDRRMKSRETHYIDHPMIGVLVLTTPIGR